MAAHQAPLSLGFSRQYSLSLSKSLQSCLTLCDPIDSSPPGSTIPGIFQARTLEWVAISFSNAWKWKVKGKSLSHIQLLVTPWTTAYQAPHGVFQAKVLEWSATAFSGQEYWSGLFPSPRHACMLSCFSHVRLCATPWTAVHQAPLSIGFSRQEYWSGLSFPSPSVYSALSKSEVQEYLKTQEKDEDVLKLVSSHATQLPFIILGEFKIFISIFLKSLS